jgi:hypothetical protein
MGDPLRALNEKGIQEFRRVLADLRDGLTPQPPKELLTNPSYSVGLREQTDVEDRRFNSKLEIATYLYEALQVFSQSDIDQNVGLWTWLSLYYFDLVCPSNRSGRRIPGQDGRHILDLEYRVYRYHLLLGPYNVYRLHGEKASLLLSGPLYETSRYYLELAARQGFITNRGIIEAANLLYFDPEQRRPKRGAAVTTRKPGALIRFIDVVQQLDLTHDLYSMTGDEVLALLPSEFDEWRPVRASAGK